MEWARYRDMTRIYLLIVGAFSITFFVRWVLIGYLEGGAVQAVACGAALFIFLLLGVYILYFGLERWDRFYSDMTVAQPAYQYAAYYQPAYYPPPGYYYPPPAYYPPPYGQPAYGMPAYYPQYPQYQQPAYQYQPANQYQPAEQYMLAYYQPQAAYPPPQSYAGYAGPYQYVPKAPAQPRELDPRRALILPEATRLLAIFLLALLLGGLALAVANYVSLLALVVFLPAFVIGFSFPSLIWISYVYHFDKTPLPSKTVLKAFVWGMLSTIPALLINTVASIATGEGEGAPLVVTLFVVAMVAPLIEEFSKPWGIWLVREDIKGPLDGLILGVTCGVGFALIENISYEFSFVLTGDSAAAVWTLGSLARGLGSIMVHAAGAGMIGYAYGRYPIGKDLPSIVLAYFAAVALHSAWNASSALFATVDWGLFATVGFMMLFVAGTYYLLRYLISRAAASEEKAYAHGPPG